MFKNAEDNRQHYIDRIARVSTYIHDHLDDALDLDRLAEVACLSRFHWHRIYRAIIGESATDTVKRLRLARAAATLAHTGKSIEEIAHTAGYSSQSAFTRAFAAVYEMPPATYRMNGSHTALLRAAQDANAHAYPVEVREIKASPALACAHRGSYMAINKAFNTLFATLHARGLSGKIIGAFGIYHDDPDAVPESALRSEAVALFAEPEAAEPPLEACIIGGGTYAVLRHTGPYSDMRAAYTWLFATWLPQSGLYPRDAPILEAYLNSPVDTPPAALLTEICLPLESLQSGESP